MYYTPEEIEKLNAETLAALGPEWVAVTDRDRTFVHKALGIQVYWIRLTSSGGIRFNVDKTLYDGYENRAAGATLKEAFENYVLVLREAHLRQQKKLLELEQMIATSKRHV